MYPTPLAYYLINLRKTYDQLGPCLGTPSALTLSHTSLFYFVHFSVTLVKLSIASSPFAYLKNLSIFSLHCKPWKTETMGVLNIKIGHTVQMLWARKVRWSQMKQPKVAFFSPPSFIYSTGEGRRKNWSLFSRLKQKTTSTSSWHKSALHPPIGIALWPLVFHSFSFVWHGQIHGLK